ncbi:MAG: Ig-like domain-containing protein [Cyclobacteriaceae bacterium]
MNKMRGVVAIMTMVVIVLTMGCGEDEAGNILVQKIAIHGLFINDGGSSQMTAVITPTNASNQEVIWTVSDESIATISTAGLLTAIENGTVIVTATAQDQSGVSASRSIGVLGVEDPVDPPILVQSISISGSDITNGLGQQLIVDVLPANADVQEVTWSVSDESVATVSAGGYLSPLLNGAVTVTATATDGSEVTGQLVINIDGINEEIEGTVVNTSQEILSALANAVAGEKIYIRGGNYTFGSSIKVGRSGTSSNVITLLAYPNDAERPTLDFSSMSENSSNRGVSLSGNYWHIKGIDFFNAGDNGLFISGSNNIIEFCTFYENSDTGLQIGNGGANNTVVNCDSYFNADSSIENADGFACKLDAGTDNKFIGCRAWNNLDDGWDGYLRGTDNITTTYENCWAIRNGRLKDGTVGGGDGNGFKTGGSDDKQLKHNAVFKNCIAAGNVVDGFDHNSNRGAIVIYNSIGHDNGRDFSFGTGNIASSLTVKNSIYFGTNNQLNADAIDITNNGWQDGLSATAADFESMNIDLLLAERKGDGSLPNVSYMKPVSGSDMIDAGVDVGLPFNGSAPDIGVFEF